MAAAAASSPTQTSTDVSPPIVRVVNADDAGMGHGSMGWLEDDQDKFFSAPAERNMAGITEVLKKHLKEFESVKKNNDKEEENNEQYDINIKNDGLVIEIGSGSGQHVLNYAINCPSFIFQPTEYPGHPNPKAEAQNLNKILNSISLYTKNIPNIKEPCFTDASKLSKELPILCEDNEAVMIIAVNVVHVSPICVMEGILNGMFIIFLSIYL